MKQSLIAYSFGHFVIDFLSAFTVFSIPIYFPELTETMLLFIVLYGLIAFALQAPLGAICDSTKVPKMFALLGLTFNLLALFMLLFSPLFAVIITGLGNALFHVGGGSIALQLGHKKATLPGIFVSTGAMGIFLGTFLPVNVPFSPLWLSILAIVTMSWIGWVKLPTLHYEAAESFSALVPKKQHALVCISFFLLLSIFIRSFMGFMVTFPRKVGFLLGVVFTLSVMCGKAFGGVLADKFGFEKVGISSLAIASVLLGWCSAYPIAGLVGIFLFNMTMPITLVALVNSFKGRPGFAFGLTTLALIIGAMPYYAGVTLANGRIMCSIILSVLALRGGLHWYRKFFSS